MRTILAAADHHLTPPGERSCAPGTPPVTPRRQPAPATTSDRTHLRAPVLAAAVRLVVTMLRPDAATGAVELRPGSRFGPYRIEAAVGRGGMATVYRAEHLHLRRQVALKVPLPGLAEDARFRERFIRESRAAATL